MPFNSLQFIVFFPIVIALYFVLSYKARLKMLLVAGCYFYMVFEPLYILVLCLLIILVYYAAFILEKAGGKKRTILFIIAICLNLIPLGIFKYYNYFIHTIGTIPGFASIPNLHILLPVGLSFYTFQSMSYLIEVYRGGCPAERNFTIYALYVSFFPQVVAGPIERPGNMMPQYHTDLRYNYDSVVLGLRLMLIGMFTKVVIADNLATVVNQVSDKPGSYHGVPVIFATYLFAIQIYCDFAGYSQIAIGAARVMGLKLMTNFDHPYIARSIPEFWRKWHISLTSWFRDYVLVALEYVYVYFGGERITKARWYFTIFMVFVLSGLWHGASSAFVVWGAIHGFYIVCSVVLKNLRERVAVKTGLVRFPVLRELMGIFITFHLVLFAWIFFRASTMGNAFIVLKNIIDFSTPGETLSLNNLEVSIAILSFVCMELFSLRGRFTGNVVANWISSPPQYVKYVFYIAMIFMIFAFGQFKSQNFIYFQF